ncbi:MAG: hypothetical protein KatS3mg031_1356 [Chitinophagales bacterium]|nr:MAG: hypothetical protein KatS3mg031_1356 [Chitinophagales bacterium]
MKTRAGTILLLFLSGLVYSQPLVAAGDFPEKPYPPRLVNDLAGFLTTAEAEKLETKLVDFDKKTSVQIAIVTVQSLGGYSIADYAAQLGEKWGVGRKGKDNGVLILASKEDREVFIATGYGMEPIIPDALAKRIIEQYMIPQFRQGRFYEGFDAAVQVIMQLASGEFTAADLEQQEYYSGKKILILLILAIILLIVISSRMRHKHYTYSGKGRSRNIYWGPFHGGGFGSGGGRWGGGGFGGFGGGSFGGGGAGGRW